MADSKLTALTEDTAPTTDDLLYLVDDAAGTPTSKRATIANVLGNANAALTMTALASDAATTAAAGNHYYGSIAGYTANRNFTLPTASAAGERIRVTVTTGDDDYELIVIGAATVTINGGSAATEWSRLFITGESVEFVSTSTTNWQVAVDARKPCFARIDRSGGTSQTMSNETWATITFSTAVFDVGDIADLTNNRINFRRNGEYYIHGEWINASASTFGSGRGVIWNASGVSGSTLITGPKISCTNDNVCGSVNGIYSVDLSSQTGCTLGYRISSTSGSSYSLVAGSANFLEVQEIL